MSPQKFKLDINSNTCQHDSDEAEEHQQHSLKGWFIEDIMICTLVDEIQHFVGSDITIGVGDSPFVFL